MDVASRPRGRSPARRVAGRRRARAEDPARWRWAVGAAVLLGLAGVAITQPLLDLLGRNRHSSWRATTSRPDHLVLRHRGGGPRCRWYSAPSTSPALVRRAWTGAPLPRRGRRPLRRPVRLRGVPDLPPRRPGVRGPGRSRAALERSWRWWRVSGSKLARQFLAYLALGNLAFVALFLTSSPTLACSRRPVRLLAINWVRCVPPPLEGP